MSTPVFKTKHWKAFLAEDQAYFGRLVIVSDRACTSLGDLTEEEQLEFFFLAKKLEQFFRKQFHASMFNWSCLMNNAYKDGETPQVHWHFRPRYAKSIVVAEKEYNDPNFGYHYIPTALGIKGKIDKAAEKILREKIKMHFAGKWQMATKN